MGDPIATRLPDLASWRARRASGRAKLHTLSLGERHETASEVPDVQSEALRREIRAMLDLMRRAGYPALAGPLVGLPLRVIAIDLSGTGDSQIVLINPTVERVSAEHEIDREGCVALPRVTVRVERHQWVVVTGWTLYGQLVDLHAGGLLGRIVQHQIDHLDGLTFLDRVGAHERARAESRLRALAETCSYRARRVRAVS